MIYRFCIRLLDFRFFTYMFLIYCTVVISQVMDQVQDLQTGDCEISAGYGVVQSCWFMCAFHGSQFSNQLI